ncbi:hypothetical protein [Humisphaera borealis]|uniref:Uncharacterized protein n=1 Tax=Humisphaera borealis TaxID=2807512 RepID=A0A7M2WS17_9BACT|nr:hypothetical protein [Humisphaera borealis]QOV88335.1 hypothetical protein IPV69_19080 [Humisphaera borealis]
MPSTKTISALTEAWPQDPANFELQSFAATLIDERPALGAPALDRIGAQLSEELDRQTRPTNVIPSRPMRIAGRISGGMAPVGRMLAPYAAAACVLVAAGIWYANRSTIPTSVPANPNGSLITNQPKNWQPAEPEDVPVQPKPAPKGG